MPSIEDEENFEFIECWPDATVGENPFCPSCPDKTPCASITSQSECTGSAKDRCEWVGGKCGPKSPAPSPDPKPKKKGLGGGAIAGIVIGVLIFVGVVAFLVNADRRAAVGQLFTNILTGIRGLGGRATGSLGRLFRRGRTSTNVADEGQADAQDDE